MSQSGGRFDFDDGGVYCGAWEDGKAHGQGICTGPKGQGEYAGSWNHGFEVLGVYTWPSGNTYKGNWSMGKRHNLGVEIKGKWEYKGEWTHGYKGRYGVRSNTSGRAKYEGTWVNGLQDGYGTETYADGGTYQGQWKGGMRHGYGVRQSVPYGIASVMRGPWKTSMSSLRSEMSNGTFSNAEIPSGSESRSGSRAGFVLCRRFVVTSQTPAPLKRSKLFRSSSTSFGRSLMGGLKMRTRSNTSIASGTSNKSCQSATSDYNSMYERSDLSSPLEAIEDDIDVNTVESYYGEWKNDARTGYGVCKQSDGMTYEGEWLDNQRHGYGATTFPDGTKEEGKYKYNAITNGTRRKNFALKSNRVRSKVAHAIDRAQKAKETAIQKVDIATSRTAHSIGKAEQAETVAQNACEEAHVARCVAKDQDPSFEQPGLEYMKQRGDIPQKHMPVGEVYLTEAERRDVEGPESYFQYSHNKESPSFLTSSSSSKQTSTDGNSMRASHSVGFNEDSRHARHNYDIHNTANKTSILSNGRSPAAQCHTPKKVQYLSPKDSPCGTPLVRRSSPKFNKKSSDKVSPQFGRKPNFSKSSSFSNVKKREENSSSFSLDNISTPRQKKGFFRSIRIRGRKISNTESGLGESVSKSSIEKIGKEAHDVFEDTNRHNAQDRRKAFQKSYTTPGKINPSISRSMDMGSFDYGSNQDIYLANYESEMRGVAQGNKTFGQNASSTRTYNAPASNPPNSYNPSLYVTAEQINVPNPPGYHNDNNHYYSTQQSSWSPETSQMYKNGPSSQPQAPNSQDDLRVTSSLSMTALRPRGSGQMEQPIRQPVTPAFATYTGPVCAENLTTDEPKHLEPESTSRHNSFKTDEDNVIEDFAYQNGSSTSFLQPRDPDHSPLPNKLRRRELTQSAPTSEMETVGEKPDADASKLPLLVLVILLIVGFMAVFLQFLT